ncbi:MAG: hypothetical protein JXR22_04335 [Prolixibacteraceae bacterium]|nr:hypothetical protein [Prolixibacteraceae bacterium]
MKLLIFITITCLIISFIFNRQKTWIGIRKGLKMFLNLAPTILMVLAAVSILLYFLPNELIVKHLGENAGTAGYAIAALVGSFALIPGFIAYPLAGALVKSGVGYPVIAVFITTLMMVGILTLPIEIKFFGLKTSLLRNMLFLMASLIIGIITGIIYHL